MRLQVKGKNLEVSDSIRAYAERKLAKLDRQLHGRPQPPHAERRALGRLGPRAPRLAAHAPLSS